MSARPSHAARVESSPRLRALLSALLKAGPRRLTAFDIFNATGSLNAHSCVDELRDPVNGYLVSCEYFTPPGGGPKRPGYRLEGSRASDQIEKQE